MGTEKRRGCPMAAVLKSASGPRRISYLCMAALLAGSLALTGLSACASAGSSGSDSGLQENGSSAGQLGGTARVAEGSEAPDFEFSTTDGQIKKLSDFRGKVVLLNFWATWCGYCIQEMPAMQQITEDYGDVVVLAVNRGDSTSEATAFAEDSSYGFVWGLDEDGSIAALYPSNGIPYSVIIDRDGMIQTIYEGSAADMYPYFERAVTAAGA